MLRFLFVSGARTPPCMDAADSDDMSGLNLTDGVFIFLYLFAEGLAPPPPSPAVTAATANECGVDETDDDPLGCETSPDYCDD